MYKHDSVKLPLKISEIVPEKRQCNNILCILYYIIIRYLLMFTISPCKTLEIIIMTALLCIHSRLSKHKQSLYGL